MRCGEIAAQPRFVDRRRLRLKIVGREADPPQQKIAIRPQADEAVAQADHPFGLLRQQRNKFLAGPLLLLRALAAESRIELEEREVDELPLNGRALAALRPLWPGGWGGRGVGGCRFAHNRSFDRWAIMIAPMRA